MNRGIFVDGKPLDDYLGVEKDKEIKSEFQETVSEITKTLWKPVVTSEPKVYVKHSRAKHLKPDQIRKEYGIMAQPLEPFWMNLLYLLEKEGPLRSTDLQTLTKLTKKQSGIISGSMIKLQQKVPEHIIKSNGRWEIYGSTAVGVAKLYNERKGKRIIKMANPAFTTPISEREKALAEIRTTPNDSPDLIKNIIREAIEKELGIKVTVEGTIRILFGFEKGE